MRRTIAISTFVSFLLTTPVAVLAQSTYRITTIAGSDSLGDGGPATSAVLQQAQGLAVDAAGYVYVADAAGNRVRRVSPAGIIETFAGTGTAGFSGDNGPADLAQLKSPYGVAVDSSRNVYIADLGNQRVRRVGIDGRIVTIAGGGSTPLGVIRDGQSAISVQLNAPRNLVVDSDNSVVFSDFAAHRVARISSGGALSIVAGTGVAGLAGDKGLAVNAQLNFPAGVALDAVGTLYIADSGNKRVRRVTRGAIDTLAMGAKAPALTSPTGVAVDSSGTVYIADSAGSQCLQVTNTGVVTALAATPQDVAVRNGYLWLSGLHEVWQWTGTSLKLVAGNSTGGLFGDGGPAIKARLSSPVSAVADANGNIYFADQGNHSVRRIEPSGVIRTVVGTGAPGFSGDNGPASAARLWSPSGIALDGAGNLYISDTGNHRIRRMTRTGVLTTVAGTGKAGNSGDGGLGTLAQLSSPLGIAADTDGSLYIADSGNHSIRKLSAAGLIGTVAGNQTAGFRGDGGPANKAELDSPAGVALDGNRQLVIADTNNQAIRRIDSNGLISSVADVLPSQWLLPQGVAAGNRGELWIADTGNGRIAQVMTTGQVRTISVLPSGDAGNNGSDKLTAPVSVVVEPSGSLLVADRDANRLYRLSPVAEDPATSTAAPIPQVLSFRLVHGASYTPTALAPGQIVSLFGDGIGPSTAVSGSTSNGTALPLQMEGRQVLFDGLPAPLFYGRSDQLTVQVPYELNGRAMTEVSLVVQGVKRASLSLPVAATAPGIFAVLAGTGQAAALNEDGTLNSLSNPARTGSVVTFYATGEGQTTPGGVSGRPAAAPWGAPLAPVSVLFSGQPGDVLFAGSAPGLIGVMQVNVRLPLTLPVPGNVDVMLIVGDASSPPPVTIAVR